MVGSLTFFIFAIMITKNTVKQIQSLKQQKYRKTQQCFVVEGRKMVYELLHSDFETVYLFATDRYLEEHPLQGVPFETVTEVQMEQMSSQDTPPGVLAVARMKTLSAELVSMSSRRPSRRMPS